MTCEPASENMSAGWHKSILPEAETLWIKSVRILVASSTKFLISCLPNSKKIIPYVLLQEDDKRTTSICESIASTVTATSEVEEVMSSEEDNAEDNADSDTTSCPSPAQQSATEYDKGENCFGLRCSQKMSKLNISAM